MDLDIGLVEVKKRLSYIKRCKLGFGTWKDETNSYELPKKPTRNGLRRRDKKKRSTMFHVMDIGDDQLVDACLMLLKLSGIKFTFAFPRSSSPPSSSSPSALAPAPAHTRHVSKAHVIKAPPIGSNSKLKLSHVVYR
eukprot:748120-Hanusia_phi.AAC.1